MGIQAGRSVSRLAFLCEGPVQAVSPWTDGGDDASSEILVDAEPTLVAVVECCKDSLRIPARPRES